jgi:hypothetical protein
MHRLPLWKLQFRMKLQRLQTKGEWQEWEAICHAAEHVDSSTSTERLAVLKSEVQQKASDLLKRFAETLLTQKPMQ